MWEVSVLVEGGPQPYLLHYKKEPLLNQPQISDDGKVMWWRDDFGQTLTIKAEHLRAIFMVDRDRAIRSRAENE